MTKAMNGTVLIGAGIGAGLMFLLDPDRGGRRRAFVRDKMMLAARKTRDAADATRRDLNNRMNDMTARVRGQFSEDYVDNRIVRERVRAELSRVALHPRAINVDVAGGIVTLTGDGLMAEVPAILSRVSSVRGVTDVRDDLTVHASADGIPALQGTGSMPDQWTSWAASEWPSAARVACAGSAIAAAIFALSAAPAQRERRRLNRTLRQVSKLHDSQPARV